ncbi:MAG: tRNA (adenosine(37)-N6)-threonylcarbamoyltransferase complex dimerization subunit type 1 TsaB [Bacteroidales bacterium]|jgi:tRNA threonylcarbamoyladenosine biosynthesis protein TsaB
MILCIETATSVCSVALCDRERIISSRENSEGKSHASLLTVYISELFNELKIKASDLEAVAVSKGPGSFTGLRIGVSVAKGIAFRASIPLIGIQTMVAMYHGISPVAASLYGLSGNSLYCPMLDARRMEIFYSLFDASGKMKKEICAEIINTDSFRDIPEDVRILFFGTGAGKCTSVLARKNNAFDADFKTSAQHMRLPAFNALDSGKFEDTAYFEPFYLKDFIATVPRKNIFGQ